MANFRQELAELINRHSLENGSDTPDFVLAAFLLASLQLFDAAVRSRERFYGRVGVLDMKGMTPQKFDEMFPGPEHHADD